MKRIFILGDVHGQWHPIYNLNKRLDYELTPEDTIILLGDVGANYFMNYRDDNFKKKLSKIPCTYFCVRGNHEERPSNLACGDPSWHQETFFEGKVWIQDKYPSIKYAMDYPSLYNIDGYSTIVFPGAYSVDKDYRLMMGYSWFKDEQLSEEEKQIGLDIVKKLGNKIDLVLSHTSPSIYVPSDLFLSSVDQSKVDTSMERYLGQIEYELDYKLFCWGHYHKFRVYPPYNGKQCLMLFNDAAIELHDWMNKLPKEIGKIW